ncbi:MAG: UDP-N-acetylglucosamine 1-carboxyvinyltransferase [Alphaproteobacteria bacterium]|nr:MAG: UDP-N-acetylglucosamine 1-carboxyvinyltransferase [Alphaproteobacteria bacterium]
MLEEFVIQGKRQLKGSVTISGAKNSALKLLPATLLTDQMCIVKNVPQVSDINTMIQLLGTLGSSIQRTGDQIRIITPNIKSSLAHYEIVRKMRASTGVLGPLLARHGEASVSLPGGCAIGARPIDIHLDGLSKMGAQIELKDGYVHAKGQLKGAVIHFKFPSMGATENIMMAATLAKGSTRIYNAACEPEIVDLAQLLNKMGAKIRGQGTPDIEIEGVDALHGAEYETMPDRLEAATYAMAALITNGKILLKNTRVEFLEPLRCLNAVKVELTSDGPVVSGSVEDQRPVNITTAPFPGFPTDMQPQMMALLTQVPGMSVISEMLFENRFMHVPELIRLGAKIEVMGRSAHIYGKTPLSGAPVIASDLRGGTALVLAALAAEGETVVKRIYHMDRGYANLMHNLNACGASVERLAQQDQKIQLVR